MDQRIRRLAIGFALLVAVIALVASAASPVLGQDSIKSADKGRQLAGIPILVLKGSHFERGHAHGKALATQIIDLYDNYLARNTSPALFLMMLRAVAPLITVSKGLEEEAKGLVAGALEAGGGTFRSKHLNEDFNWSDVLALSTYVDYVGTNCSSLSAWGKATGKSRAKGGVVLVRNLDWSKHQALLRNQMVFVHIPSEEEELPLVSIGFAGFLGCLSCMNGEGLGAFLNLGYGSRSGTFPPADPFVPAALGFRQAVETKPAKGVLPLQHFVTRLTDSSRVGSFIIHAVAPPQGDEDPAAVVELLPGTHEIRTAADNETLGPNTLVATNHHRKASKPSQCRRYEAAGKFVSGLKGNLTMDDLWQVLDVVRRPDTMQSMRFVPASHEFTLSVLLPSGLLKKAGTSRMTPPETVTLDELFKLAD